jgi:hypothetical protein
MVVTEGDSFAELVERENLGAVVAVEDVDALSAALDRALFDEQFAQEARENVRRVAEEFTWEQVLMPLTEFVRNPSHASDYGVSTGRGVAAGSARKPYGFRHDARMALHYLQHSGLRVTWQKIRRRTGLTK